MIKNGKFVVSDKIKKSQPLPKLDKKILEKSECMRQQSIYDYMVYDKKQKYSKIFSNDSSKDKKCNCKKSKSI